MYLIIDIVLAHSLFLAEMKYKKKKSGFSFRNEYKQSTLEKETMPHYGRKIS
jgi:hypothetical protein